MIHIIGSANGSGGRVMGAEKAAETMKQSDLMNDLHVAHKWVDTVEEHPTGTQFKALPGIVDTSIRLGQKVQDQIRNGNEVVVIAGDHSSAIGTWSGVANAIKSEGDLGLIWIDAHLDAHRPDTSETGNIHGMPVSHLLGYGDEKLYRIFDFFPKIKPHNFVYIGIRSYEPPEQEFVEARRIKVYYQNECDERDIAEILAEAIECASFGTAGFGLTIDLDAFREEDCPGVGTPEKGGVVVADFIDALKKANLTNHLATEIVEFNPRLDVDRRTEKVIVELLDAIYCNKLGITARR